VAFTASLSGSRAAVSKNRYLTNAIDKYTKKRIQTTSSTNMTPIISRDHMRCKRVEPESPCKSIKKTPASFFPGLQVESVQFNLRNRFPRRSTLSQSTNHTRTSGAFSKK
jgi:hypothetical protein